MSIFGTRLKETALVSIYKELQKTQMELNKIEAEFESSREYDRSERYKPAPKDGTIVRYRSGINKQLEELKNTIIAKLDSAKWKNLK